MPRFQHETILSEAHVRGKLAQYRRTEVPGKTVDQRYFTCVSSPAFEDSRMIKVRTLLHLSSITLLVVASGCDGRSNEASRRMKLHQALRTAYSSVGKERQVAGDFVRKCGTNAVPQLLEMLKSKEDHEASMAAHGFEFLGVVGASAIPELSTMLVDTNYTSVAAEALSYIGAPAVPVLTQELENPNPAVVKEATLRVSQLGTNASTAIPVLLRHLTNENSTISIYAANALGELRLRPEVVIPALTNQIWSANSSMRYVALDAIRHFKENARPAVPAIWALLTHPDKDTRKAATNVLENISFDVYLQLHPPTD
jgi:hypothetical protein